MGKYSPKYGYNYLMSKKGWAELEWWCKSIWKLKCLTKARPFFWCILRNKVLTWDNIQKINKMGLGWCLLCKKEEESVQHLLLKCPFNKRVWEETMRLTEKSQRWGGENIREVCQKWWNDTQEENLKYLPLIISWGTWLA